MELEKLHHQGKTYRSYSLARACRQDGKNRKEIRDIKAFVEIAPVYVRTKAHVKAHYTICVLSHLINRTIILRLLENRGDITSEIVFHEQLYTKLSDCQVDRIEVENLQLSAYNITNLSTKQEELLNRFGVNRANSKRNS